MNYANTCHGYMSVIKNERVNYNFKYFNTSGNYTLLAIECNIPV